MTKALVTGSNGFVGSNLCRELAGNGYQVRALHRAGSDLSALQGLDLELFEGDVCDPASLQKACKDVEMVFHIAALFRQAKHPDSVYHQVNVDGVKNVFEAAISCNVRKIIHCSTVGVHSHIPNPPADEHEEYRPGDIYQETKCEGEKAALEYFKQGKIDGVIIRPAMIWGPGDKRTLKLFRGIAGRRFPLIGSGKTLLHWVLVTDLARAFRLAAEKPTAPGDIFIIAGERAVTMKQLYQTVADKYGVKPLPIRIPALPVQLLGDLVEIICIPLGVEPPIYRRRVDFFTKTRSFDCSKAKAELGYSAAYSFEEEVAMIADWYKEQGWA